MWGSVDAFVSVRVCMMDRRRERMCVLERERVSVSACTHLESVSARERRREREIFKRKSLLLKIFSTSGCSSFRCKHFSPHFGATDEILLSKKFQI